MEIDLRGKVAIVTGVGRGIGREIVSTLAREGVTTVSVDVSTADLEATGRLLDEQGAAHREFACDIRDSARVNEVVAAVEQEFGRIDILVNNAGVVGNGPIDGLDEATWDLVHDVNLKGTFLMCRAVLPVMKRQRSGRILNAASFAAISPIYASGAYASSKIAVAHFTRALAGEVGPWNITANAYAPGMVPTAMNHFDELPQAEQDRLLDTLTLRRWGSKTDIASLICFLSSDLAGYITGTLIDISGGKLATQVPRLAYEAAAAAGEYEFAALE
ncbi:SDR family NAD(P)-dependent oxidoreductase [Agromyces aerolatus]|uniref:SDR family NAD(P)-dependent oxidoreductase n=1 Tax=Agromyces sp. LY-1074 TaxID=3074080 RepID=UPI0028649A1B|nr:MULTISPECIES: SDR family NAD(P)-dependent oxidoreductase [unclassified Agromyces]MDR5701107.1 SDR family NAD(P)-dependent oxidoreductase [Agromyces sp. LY-1074]MDR5707747.1 SDR family NAD(P)-dependent oxidoreductase [Agromyces sp. LY-1358]